MILKLYFTYNTVEENIPFYFKDKFLKSDVMFLF